MGIHLDTQASRTGPADVKDAPPKLGIQRNLVNDHTVTERSRSPSSGRRRIIPLDALEQLLVQSR
jgi:hypothetical protein